MYECHHEVLSLLYIMCVHHTMFICFPLYVKTHNSKGKTLYVEDNDKNYVRRDFLHYDGYAFCTYFTSIFDWF